MPDAPDSDHRRPDGLADDTVKAQGKLSEALEMVEEARSRPVSGLRQQCFCGLSTPLIAV